MNHAIFWRIVWKEYRAQRAFWLAVAVTAIVLQIGSLWIAGAHASWLFGVSIVLPAFYALGCAVVLFGSEREEGTVEFLRALPASPDPLFAGKLIFGLASTAVMPIPLLIIAWALSPSLATALERSGGPGEAVAMWGIWTSGFFAWGLLFSLLTSRVLNAVCLAVTAMVVFLSGLMWLDRLNDWVWIAVPLAVVAAVDVWLARRWMREPRSWTRVLVQSAGRSTPLASLAIAPDFEAEGSRQMRRLLWEEWRQAWGIAAVYLVSGVLICLLPEVPALRDALFLTAIFLLVVPVLIGVGVFRGEQSRYHYRFLAERGISPTVVWLSKHGVWLPLTGLILLSFVLADALGTRVLDDLLREPQQVASGRSAVPAAVLAVCTMYAAAQFVSLLIRNSITATFVSVACLMLIYPWHAGLHLARAPLIFSAAPSVILMLLSLVRISDWMHERNALRDWAKFALIALVPTALTLGALIAFRVYEIPGGGPGFSIEEYTNPSPAAAKTAAAYRDAAQRVASYPVVEDPPGTKGDDRIPLWDDLTRAEQEWFHQHESMVALLLEASSRPECGPLHEVTPAGGQVFRDYASCQYLVLTSALKLQSEGKLGEAFECYLAAVRMGRHISYGLEIRARIWLRDWASHPDQTGALLESAIEQLVRIDSRPPSAEDWIKSQHVWQRNAVMRGRWRDWQTTEPFKLFAFELIGPWETTRTLRMLDAITRHRLETIGDYRQVLASGTPTMLAWRRQQQQKEGPARERPPWKWTFTTVAPFPLTSAGAELRYLDLLTNLEVWRRATLLTIALEAWKVEHGGLPDRLEQLVGTYLAELPQDPWNGSNFGYRPEGFPNDVHFYGQTVDADEPLLWSVGALDGRIEARENKAGKRFFIALSDNELNRNPNQPPTTWGVCLPFVIR